MAPSPQPIRRSPFQGNLASILLSPSRRPSAVVVQEQEPIHEPVASNPVPSNLPEVFQNSDALPGPKFFPIFVNHAPAPPMSHEMRFNAAAASPLRPPLQTDWSPETESLDTSAVARRSYIFTSAATQTQATG